jgi:hypothetical protein
LVDRDGVLRSAQIAGEDGARTHVRQRGSRAREFVVAMIGLIGGRLADCRF